MKKRNKISSACAGGSDDDGCFDCMRQQGGHGK